MINNYNFFLYNPDYIIEEIQKECKCQNDNFDKKNIIKIILQLKVEK